MRRAGLAMYANEYRMVYTTRSTSEKLFIRQADFAVLEAAAHAPRYIFGYASGFFLCQAGHYRYQQFAFGIQRVNILFLEIDLHAFFFKFSHSCQRIHSIPGEAADAFCFGQNQIDFSGKRVGDHSIEPVAALRARPGNT